MRRPPWPIIITPSSGSITNRRASSTSTSTRRTRRWSGITSFATFIARDRAPGKRIEENKPFFEDVAKAIADAGAILIVGPAQEKDFFAKFLAEKHPAIRAHVEGVEKADHPTDGELLDFARRYVKAADHMRPQIDPPEAGKP